MGPKFDSHVIKILTKWKRSNPALFKKFTKVVEAVAADPRRGIGHPEPMVGGKMNNNLCASNAIHPGEMIKDEIEYRGISQKDLAREIGIPASGLNAVLNGKRAVTTEYALLLEAALGIEADLWLRLQSEYDKQVTISV